MMDYVYVINQFDIMQYVEDDRVKAVAYAINGDSIVVALLVEPIFLRSDREKLVNGIKENLSEDFSNVTVSLDTEVYYRASLGNIDYNELKSLADSRK